MKSAWNVFLPLCSAFAFISIISLCGIVTIATVHSLRPTSIPLTGFQDSLTILSFFFLIFLGICIGTVVVGCREGRNYY
ncbi:hypothetical protein EMCRGX_G032548 [Ephydatia muelleri]